MMNLYRDLQYRRFANGMGLYVLERPGSSVELQCVIRTGAMHEADKVGCGLSHFLEHMLFQGCDGYPGTSAADTISALGGDMNAYTSYDRTVCHLRIASEHAAAAVRVMAAMVRSPWLDADRFAAEREVILRECDRSADNATKRIFERLLCEMFPDHPLGIPIIGLRDRIAAVDRDMAAYYHATHYIPERCFWVAAGGVDADELAAELEKLLGDWGSCGGGDFTVPPVPKPAGFLREAEFVFPDQLARLMAGVRVPESVTPAEADLLFGVLGMGSGSRLVRDLELKRKLAVELRAFMSLPGGEATGGVFASAVPGKLATLEKALFADLSAIGAGALTTGEIEREKRQQYAEFLRQLRDPGGIAADIVESVCRFGTPDASERFLAQLEAITPERLRECARILLDPANFILVRQLDKPRPVRRHERSRRGFECAEEKLPGGPTLLHLPDPSLPLVQLTLLLPGGAIFEPASAVGSSSLLGSLMTSGTVRHGEMQILTRFDAAGADFGVAAGLNSLAVTLNAPKKYFRRAAALVAELIAEPRIPLSAFRRERDRAVEALRSNLLSPAVSALFRADQRMFGGHPYGRGRFGSPETLGQLELPEVESFFDQLFCPGRMIVGLSGDVTEKAAHEIAAELLAAAEKRRGREPELPSEPHFPASDVVEELPLAGREQCAVALALPGTALGCDDFRCCFDILSKAENHLSARIFKRVREDNFLAYSVGMELFGGFHRGRIAFCAQTAPENRRRVAELFAEEIARLADTGLDPEEFSAARESAVFAAVRETESSALALSAAALAVHYGRSVASVTEEIETLRDLTREKFNAVIRPYFSGVAKVTVFAGKL